VLWTTILHFCRSVSGGEAAVARVRSHHTQRAARRVGGGACTLNVGRISGSTVVRSGATAPTSVGGTAAGARRAVVVANERAARVAHDRNAAIVLGVVQQRERRC